MNSPVKDNKDNKNDELELELKEPSSVVYKRFILKCCCVILAVVVLFATGFSNCAFRHIDEYEVEYLIGVSQANMRDPWRLSLMQELEEEAAKYSNVRIVSTDATDDSMKQIEDIQRLMGYGIDLLIVSPNDTENITPVVSEVYQKIPVIVMDRAVKGFDYTLFIGPDNLIIGNKAGEAVVELSGGKDVNVLELAGSMGFSATELRSRGFDEVISQYSNIHPTKLHVSNESRDAAEDILLEHEKLLQDIDIIMAHNDYMALGARIALDKMGLNDVKIVGIDGFSGEDRGLDLVKRGMISETITCPTGGKEAIQQSLDILNHVSGVPKQIILRSHRVNANNVVQFEASRDADVKEFEGIPDVGYIQIGMESEFRLAANQSMASAARDVGINLVQYNADQSQEKQIEAIRQCIADDMDVIILSPVVDDGWDDVLREAQEAGIPVLLSDRNINVSDDSLYESFIGADFIEEGRRAMNWMKAEIPVKSDGIVRIMELKGNEGASPTTDRKKGFEEVLRESPGYEIVHSEFGDFTKEGGKRIVEQYFDTYGTWDIDAIYAHNDDMALGAIEALEEHGVKPGVDVKIVSIDGTRSALEALMEGKLNCVLECNPLLGPQVMKAVNDLLAGKELPLGIITDEIIFTQGNVADEIGNRKY